MLLKERPEDFIVEEIPLNGKVLKIDKEVKRKSKNGDFTHFVLRKRNFDTLTAIIFIASKLGVGRKRFGYAGMKDKRSISTQLVSVWGIEPEEIRKVVHLSCAKG